MRTIKICLFLFGIFAVIACHSQDSLLIDSRDGKKYRMVTIGSQTWMAENLRFNPLPGIDVRTNLVSSVLPIYYIDSISKPDTKEYFYNWKAAQNVCPSGWRLPNKQDIKDLLNSVSGGDLKKAYHELLIGGSSGFNSIQVGCFKKNLNGLLEHRGLNGSAVFHIAPSKKYDKNGHPIYCDFISLNSFHRKAMVRKGDVEEAYSVRCLKDN